LQQHVDQMLTKALRLGACIRHIRRNPPRISLGGERPIRVTHLRSDPHYAFAR